MLYFEPKKDKFVTKIWILLPSIQSQCFFPCRSIYNVTSTRTSCEYSGHGYMLTIFLWFFETSKCQLKIFNLAPVCPGAANLCPHLTTYLFFMLDNHATRIYPYLYQHPHLLQNPTSQLCYNKFRCIFQLPHNITNKYNFPIRKDSS
jgi:hypothetical protein